MSRRTATVFVVVGIAFVIVGGLLSAAQQQMAWERGSWLVAYLVLVGGVGQAAIGAAQHQFGRPSAGDRAAWTQFVLWNAGNALVIVGSLNTIPWLVDVGGVALLACLVLALAAVRSGSATWLAWGYRILLLVLAVSIPIGLVLAHVRAG